MLPSDTIQNPRNDGSCMAINTWNGKVLSGLSLGKAVNDEVIKEDVELKEGNLVKPEKLDGIDIPSNHQQVDEVEQGKEKEKQVVVKTLPKLPPPFL